MDKPQPGQLAGGRSPQHRDWAWPFWPIVPLYPYGQRRTIRQEVVPETIWTFEQIQGIFYVVTPIRMTVVRLAAGGLLVYAPVAPTQECVGLVNELEAWYGLVRYIVLPTVSGIEHKVFVGPFARRFPQAQVWVTPHQWSYPVNLPLSWLGLPPGRTHILPPRCEASPFAPEFDYAILGPIELGLGPFLEVAFFHKSSQTLLVTDSVISVPVDPPAVVMLDPYPLLFHARDRAADLIVDTPKLRRKGWQRIVLFSLYFSPSALQVPPWGEVVREAWQAPDHTKKAYFGLFPFRWQPDWAHSFAAVQGEGRLFVAPILQTLILNRGPSETINWANLVASWEFRWLIPCHFSAPVKTNPQDFRRAFTFLEKQPALVGHGSVNSDRTPLNAADFQLLRSIEAGLNRRGITPPAQDKV